MVKGNLRELYSIEECGARAQTTNACPTLGYPAYTHLIRIYAANTCINYIKNEFIATPAHKPALVRAPHTQGDEHFARYLRIPFSSDRFLSLTAVSRFLLEYLFAFHSDFDTPFLLPFIPFHSIVVGARGSRISKLGVCMRRGRERERVDTGVYWSILIGIKIADK